MPLVMIAVCAHHCGRRGEWTSCTARLVHMTSEQVLRGLMMYLSAQSACATLPLRDHVLDSVAQGEKIHTNIFRNIGPSGRIAVNGHIAC